MTKRRSRPYLLIALAATVGAFLVRDAAAQDGCKFTTIGTAKVAAVRDGRTLLLDDGRVLRLAAIEVTDDIRAIGKAAPPDIRFGSPGSAPRRDRYGRLVAFAFIDDAQQSVQQALLEQGRARVSARVGDKACADGLLSAERAARRPGAGYGPIQISPLCRPKIVPSCRLSGAGSRWWKARSCRYAKAGPLYM